MPTETAKPDKPIYKCKRPDCGYVWQAKAYRWRKPKCCPNCHSYRWDDQPKIKDAEIVK